MLHAQAVLPGHARGLAANDRPPQEPRQQRPGGQHDIPPGSRRHGHYWCVAERPVTVLRAFMRPQPCFFAPLTALLSTLVRVWSHPLLRFPSTLTLLVYNLDAASGRCLFAPLFATPVMSLCRYTTGKRKGGKKKKDKRVSQAGAGQASRQPESP